MAQSGYILAIDQGTTGTTALLLDGVGGVLGRVSREIAQIYPSPGWVEHSPGEILDSCLHVVDELFGETGVSPEQIEAIGIANQRETTLVWDRYTGEPVSNAVVWQCRRSAPICDALERRGMGPHVREKTGLPIDPYFSATKLRWVLDNVPLGQARAERGDLLFGTVDTWLLWNLTGRAVHATDVTNASRTMLYDIAELAWDDHLLDALDIPRAMLPDVKPSSGIFGLTQAELFRGQEIPIAGVAGDQHAALFGQACFRPGMIKSTYGTGCFVLANTGGTRVSSRSGLITTIAWDIGDGVTYALEGSVFSAGATVQWLRDGLGIIQSSEEVNRLAETVEDNGGVYLVPAFTGLGAPYWDPDARGAIVGLTRGSTAGHLARAALEATVYQTRGVIEAMAADAGLGMDVLRVDGGGSASRLMMQHQADVLGVPIERCAVAETTALGAGYLAGLATGMWDSPAEIEALWRSDARFEAKMPAAERHRLYGEFQRAVERARGWERGADRE